MFHLLAFENEVKLRPSAVLKSNIFVTISNQRRMFNEIVERLNNCMLHWKLHETLLQ